MHLQSAGYFVFFFLPRFFSLSISFCSFVYCVYASRIIRYAQYTACHIKISRKIAIESFGKTIYEYFWQQDIWVVLEFIWCPYPLPTCTCTVYANSTFLCLFLPPYLLSFVSHQCLLLVSYLFGYPLICSSRWTHPCLKQNYYVSFHTFHSILN